MSEIGRKGGETVSQDRSHMEQIGKKGGEASHFRKETPIEGSH
jgi:general stress protein YciG